MSFTLKFLINGVIKINEGISDWLYIGNWRGGRGVGIALVIRAGFCTEFCPFPLQFHLNNRILTKIIAMTNHVTLELTASLKH